MLLEARRSSDRRVARILEHGNAAALPVGRSSGPAGPRAASGREVSAVGPAALRRQPADRPRRGQVAPAPPEAVDPGRLVRWLLRLVERFGWLRGALLCAAASAAGSLAVTMTAQVALGVPSDKLWIGGLIGVAVPLGLATPVIAVGLRLVAHLAELRRRLEREVESRAAAEARLRRLVSEDELTGLGNRRDFLARARTALAIGRRQRHGVGIVMVDLDRFKDINDSHGHQAGDGALVRVARILRQELRATDTAARLGGDEFVVLLPQADTASAVTVAERIRAAVADDVAEPALTVTIGCVVSGNTRAQLAGLIRAADQALYAGKKAGRNCVFVAGRSGPVAAGGSLPSALPG